jgi:hypothetical protein
LFIRNFASIKLIAMPQNSDVQNVHAVFNQFRESISKVDWDIHFWKHFLKNAIQDTIKSEPESRRFFEAGFAVYDIPSDGPNGWLWVDGNETFTIESKDLEEHRKNFFRVILNLSLLKAYSAMEIFLFQCILLAYFPQVELKNGKSATKTCDEAIKKFFREHPEIGKLETKNNRHLIAFLKCKGQSFTDFAAQPVRVNFKTDWEAFFEMMSILRNVVGHQDTLLTNDSLNEIKTSAKDIFEVFFEYRKEEFGFYILHPKEDSFGGVLSFINDFSVNAVKFIFQEKDLSFLGLVCVPGSPVPR